MLRSELVISGRRPASWMGFRRKSRMRSPSMSITGRGGKGGFPGASGPDCRLSLSVAARRRHLGEW